MKGGKYDLVHGVQNRKERDPNVNFQVEGLGGMENFCSV